MCEVMYFRRGLDSVALCVVADDKFTKFLEDFQTTRKSVGLFKKWMRRGTREFCYFVFFVEVR